jgi:putative spermidine/putrescine transport system ATP-binding protein
MAFLELAALGARYGKNTVVADLGLTAEKGEFLSILGPSGCGKTTTLRMIAGFVAPSSGTIRLAGNEIHQVPPHKRNIGYVFQNYALFAHLSVADNVAFGLKCAMSNPPCAPSAQRRRSILWAWGRLRRASPPSFPAASSSAWRWRARA